MTAIVDRPSLIHPKFYSNSCYRPTYYCHGLSYFCCPSRVSLPSSRTDFIRKFPSRLLSSYRQVGVFRDFSNSPYLLGRREFIKTRANGSCEQDADSTASAPESNDSKQGSKGKQNSSSQSSPGKGREGRSWFRRGKGRWQWQWQPLIQAQEIGVLLLQLGIMMFVMRLLRPGISLPGSEPRPPTIFVSVPYSEFLNKINSNQVQKVEVDGVQIRFRLKDEVSGESEVKGSVSNFQDTESLLRSVAPTKRIIYSTTRPADIKAPYEKMLENNVEFGSPDKRSGGFLNSALVSWLVWFLLNE